MKSSDETFDADSLLKDLVEIIDESPSACATPASSATQLYLNWPTGNDVLVAPSADWPATRHQPETEIGTWTEATGSDVTVVLGDYTTGGFCAAGVADDSPATWEAVFETEPAVPLTPLCLLPPERFDVNRLISVPSFVVPPATGNHDNDDVSMTTTQSTQGILLHNADPCDKLEDSLDVLYLDIDLDAGRPLDIPSTTPPSTILTLNPPGGVWMIAPGGPSQNILTTQLSSPALPLNVTQPLRGGTSVMESSLDDVGSGKNRLCSRCFSDSEVQLTSEASPVLVRQGSKRQRKGTAAATTRAPGVRGRSTSEAGPSRTTNTEDVRLSGFFDVCDAPL